MIDAGNDAVGDSLDRLAAAAGEALARAGLLLATAESCTGGLIAERVTSVSGSSGWFDRAFITYSNAAKEQMLGIDRALMVEHGAVSEAVVEAMVTGALASSDAGVAVAVSGVAGPGGGTEAKPVGTVCLAWGLRDAEPASERILLRGDRESIRRQAAARALAAVIDLVRERAG